MSGAPPYQDMQLLKPIIEEPHPPTHALAAVEAIENRPKYARSKTHRELLETKAAEAEAEGEEEEEEEGEEEGEGEEGEEGEAEEEEDISDGDEDFEWPPKNVVPHSDLENGYFLHGEKLRKKFNEVELDSFMKLLNVKPIR